MSLDEPQDVRDPRVLEAIRDHDWWEPQVPRRQKLWEVERELEDGAQPHPIPKIIRPAPFPRREAIRRLRDAGLPEKTISRGSAFSGSL